MIKTDGFEEVGQSLKNACDGHPMMVAEAVDPMNVSAGAMG